MRRVGWAEFIRSGPPRGEPFWLDCPLWDIPNTLEHAVRSAHRSGALAVTFHREVVKLDKYVGVMRACRELNLQIWLVAEPDYARVLYTTEEADKCAVR